MVAFNNLFYRIPGCRLILTAVSCGFSSEKVPVYINIRSTKFGDLKAKYSKVIFNNSGATLQGQELINFLSSADKAIIGIEEISGRLGICKYIEAFNDI